MNDNNLKNFWVSFKSSFLIAPFELKIIFIISLIISLTDFYINAFGSRELIEKIIPVTGWVPGSFYFNLTVFSFLILSINSSKKIWLRNIIVIAILYGIIRDAYNFYSLKEVLFSENPYLRISPYKPIWKVYIPLVWLIILLSPRISKFCKIEN